MKNFYFSKSCYDWLGEDRFRDMINEILQREFKGKDFYIGPSKGRDSGIDAQFLKPKEKQRVVQYKWREIMNKPLSEHMPEILKEFEDWAESQSKNEGVGECLFITNISLTDKYRKRFQGVINKYKSPHIQYWSFEEINYRLKKYDDLYYKYLEELPNVIKQERDELRKTLDKIESRKLIKRGSSSDFKKIEQSFQQLFISPVLKMKYYFSFIYLLAPLYKGEKDKVRRNNLRKIFRITEKEEKIFINELYKKGLIEITGDLITVKNKDEAKRNLNEVINKSKIDLSKIVNLFFE